jgi:glycoprotein endo-alpha-1,2-mannosidase
MFMTGANPYPNLNRKSCISNCESFSYQIAAASWSTIFSSQGIASIRKTEFDVIALGLWVEESHGHDLASAVPSAVVSSCLTILRQLNGGFDGFYTYFASEGFVFGSSRSNWQSMVEFANRNGLLSSISVGPGMYARMRAYIPGQRITEELI